MKKETVPPIKLNDQAALDYTLYMMLTGCFKKTECKSQALEEQLYLIRPVQNTLIQTEICLLQFPQTVFRTLT